MEAYRRQGEVLLLQRVSLIESTIEASARRHRLRPEESQDLYSQVMLKLIAKDFAVLRSFEGRSSWRTYLRVVIERVWLDHRNHEWGRWRPSAVARRLGETAVRLERRINRDRLEAHEAVRELAMSGFASVSELEDLSALLPRRAPRRFVSAEDEYVTLREPETADSRLERGEGRRDAAQLRAALDQALGELPAEERRLLGLRFARGFTVRRIASDSGLEERPLYRRFERLLRRLRHRLEARGFEWLQVGEVLEGGYLGW